jgi:hypothetical protein
MSADSHWSSENEARKGICGLLKEIGSDFGELGHESSSETMIPTDKDTNPRVEPVAAPYSPEFQAVFDQIMPAGVPPLSLFTTLARVPRVYEKFRAGGLVDRGPVALRHRRD